MHSAKKKKKSLIHAFEKEFSLFILLRIFILQVNFIMVIFIIIFQLVFTSLYSNYVLMNFC